MTAPAEHQPEFLVHGPLRLSEVTEGEDEEITPWLDSVHTWMNGNIHKARVDVTPRDEGHSGEFYAVSVSSYIHWAEVSILASAQQTSSKALYIIVSPLHRPKTSESEFFYAHFKQNGEYEWLYARAEDKNPSRHLSSPSLHWTPIASRTLPAYALQEATTLVMERIPTFSPGEEFE